MTGIIVIFAVLVVLAGIVILVNPEILFGYLRRKIDGIEIHLLAVVVRFILGFLLIRQADYSRFPLTIEILGWLSITAALVLALMGRRNFRQLMSRAFVLVKPYGRAGGVLAIAFGGFLLYAFAG